MKKIMMFMMFALISSPMFGWEIKGNPDRVPSVALSIDKGTLTGGGKQSWNTYFYSYPYYYYLWANGKVESETEISIITPSVRLPLSQFLTLDLRVSLISNKTTMTGFPIRMNYNQSGEVYGGTLRAYFE